MTDKIINCESLEEVVGGSLNNSDIHDLNRFIEKTKSASQQVFIHTSFDVI